MAARRTASIPEHFAGLPDPRDACRVQHPLLGIVILTICAVTAGADDWVEVVEYGRAKKDWLRRFIDLPNGIPSHDTLSTVFSLIAADEFERCFVSWTHAVFRRTKGEVVAIDGKTARRSHDRWKGIGPIHVISAWACANGVVLGQHTTAAHAGEITGIPALLRLLDVAGCIVTIDAAGCQTPIARQIIAQKADYVLAVKDNQPTLAADVREHLDAPERKGDRTVRRYRTVEKDHGRIETRTYTIAPAPAWTGGATEWPGLASIAKVTATRTMGATKTLETRYYISSLPPRHAARIAAAIRRHWSIENGLHWSLDVTFDEDQSRVRTGHAAENLALIRRLVLSLLKQDDLVSGGIAVRRHRAGWDDDYLQRILSR